MELSPDQRSALKAIESWIKEPNSFEFILSGLAGTGKTTLLAQALKSGMLPEYCTSVCCPTGKAASVLRSKLGSRYHVNTIHSLFYRPIKVDGNLQFMFTGIPDNVKYIVIDEASMVSSKIKADLDKYQLKTLYIGDHGQLPPVASSDPKIFSLDDGYNLTEIHRVSLNSPILSLSYRVRDGFVPKKSEIGKELSIIPYFKFNRKFEDITDRCNVILCGYNNTREKLNNRIRRLRGFKGILNQGETIVITRNNHDLGVMNGERLRVVGIHSALGDNNKFLVDLKAESGLRLKNVKVWIREEVDVDVPEGEIKPLEADYGYAMTVHKSQGSEWDRVCVIDEGKSFSDSKRWRYTAVTRAKQELVYVKS